MKKVYFEEIQRLDKALVNLYLVWFQKPSIRHHLYGIAPKSSQEIKSWLVDCCLGKAKQYFLVFKEEKVAGHIGLKKIDLEKGTAEIGSFFIQRQDNYNWIFREVIKFIVSHARNLGLKLIAVDHSSIQVDSKVREALDELGFTQDPLAPNYFTLKI